MKLDQPIKYSEKIVAFVDILGFSNLIETIEEDRKLHERLHRALTHIRSYKDTSSSVDTAASDIEISVFSDCIVISSEPNKFHDVIWASGWLQAKLLGVGVLTRGGIAVGNTYHSNDILYGKGMLDAYQIEKSAAVYPRISLHPKLADSLPEKYKLTFLDVDSDGLWFIDPFSFPATVSGNLDELVADGWDPHELFLDELGQHIEEGIKKAIRVDHIAKWTWLKIRYSLAKDNYLITRETKLTLMMKHAEQRH